MTSSKYKKPEGWDARWEGMTKEEITAAYRDNDFASLNMMGEFTDEELVRLGMTPKDIEEYRAFVKKVEEEQR